jgi:tRNA nucleotidyltransferase (CCA-adding enzyme)
MARLSSQQALVEEIVPLVLHHLKPRQLQQAEASDAAIRRLARKVKRIDRLARVARADERGRPPLTWENGTAPDWLLERAAALDVEDRSPQPLVQGRHLIERGLEPGPDFGPLLDRCFEAQLDGAFTSLEEGRTFLDAVLRETGEGP